MGLNLSNRYDHSVFVTIVVSTAASAMVMAMLRERGKWWMIATSSLIATQLLDVQWHIAAGGINAHRIAVTFWESFWPAGAAFALAQIIARAKIPRPEYY
jgi:hypothetical protein